MPKTRVYGVSTGNGNDGVSHMHADYYVRTDAPWELARRALRSEFKPEQQDEMEMLADIDGDEDYTISAVIYDDPDLAPPSDDDDDEGSDWFDDSGPAWFILEVFPEDDEEWLAERTEGPYGRPIYSSISEALGDEE